MVEGTTNTGEEYVADLLSSTTVEVALISEQLSNIQETDTLSTLTEVGSSEYSRQQTTVSVQKQSGDYTLTNDSKLTWDVTGGTITVNSYLLLVNFTSDETGDSTSNWHILAPGSFNKSVDLSQGVDVIEVSSGSLGTKIN